MKARCLPVALVLGIVISASTHGSSANQTLTAAQARDHVGETATVCGTVASAHYAFRTRGQPTFLNLDRPYPKETFTVVIWGVNREKFGKPERRYRDKHICVTGPIKVHRGVPETVVQTPKQITVK